MIEKKNQFSFIRFPLKLLHLHNQILEFMQIFPNKGRMGLVSKQSFLTNQREKMVQKTNNGVFFQLPIYLLIFQLFEMKGIPHIY